MKYRSTFFALFVATAFFILAGIDARCGMGQTESTAAESNWVRIDGDAKGVAWTKIVEALQPAVEIPSLKSTASDFAIPWIVLEVAAADSHGSLRIELDDQQRPRGLVVDTNAFSKQSREWKQKFAELRAAAGDSQAYRLETLPSSDVQDTNTRVLVIAGYQSQQGEAASVATFISRTTKRTCEVYSFPSDGMIDVSAEKLAKLLRERSSENPALRWQIVGHSMGGILARAAIERHQAPNVTHLIQIFPPNHGCVLAEIAEPLDGAMIAGTQLTRILGSLENPSSSSTGTALTPSAMLHWMCDGFALASRDLCPNSEFLRTLNQSKRNPSVKYTILSGTGGPLNPSIAAGMLLLGPALEENLRTEVDAPEIRQAHQWVRKLISDGQLIRGAGDGVVSVASTKLSGVSDVVLLDCHHVAWTQLESEMGKRIMQEVVKRLAGD